MKIKHKLQSDYQHLSVDKKIFLIKAGTILNNYIYQVKDEEIVIDSDIVNSNPEIFKPVDWKQELHAYIKSNKLPQPKTLANKLEPFIEEMILAGSNNSKLEVDEDKIKELEHKESDLDRRDKKIKDKEEEIEIRLKRVEKREIDYKEDLKILDKKEDDLRGVSKSLKERELDIEDKLQDINEKERNLESIILEKSQEKVDLDDKYKKLQSKIDKDIELVSNKEKAIEKLNKELLNKESEINDKESEINDKIRDFEIKVEEFKQWGEEVEKLDKEIKDWEDLHWKFKRTTKPPSAI